MTSFSESATTVPGELRSTCFHEATTRDTMRLSRPASFRSGAVLFAATTTTRSSSFSRVPRLMFSTSGSDPTEKGRRVREIKRDRTIPSEQRRRFLERQARDPFAREARNRNWRSRAAFKLVQLDAMASGAGRKGKGVRQSDSSGSSGLKKRKRKGLLSRGARVVDLGCAPGGWCGVAAELVGSADPLDGSRGAGCVIGVDLVEMEPVAGTTFIHGDFLDMAVLERVREALATHTAVADKSGEERDDAEFADVVLSDMAPRASGDRGFDHARLVELCMGALNFCRAALRPGGSLVVKCSFGGEEGDVRKAFLGHFESCVFAKPEASRADSREVYLVARGFQERLKTPG
jgi:23S rRNA (uridine2552-2'-O)-methyltransferase